MGFQDMPVTAYPVNMRSQNGRGSVAGFLHITLGIWLGVYAFRAFVSTAVWNLSDALPLALKGALAIGVHAGGVAGWVLPITKRKNSALMLAVAVAAIGILRQIFIGNDVLGSAFSLASWIVWLWWLASLARRFDAADAPTIAAAFATALSLQTGMQAAWHGLDLPMARGFVAVVCAIAINALFATTAKAFVPASTETELRSSTRMFISLGIALFLELTLLANVGRIGAITHFGLLESALLIQAGLILGLLIAAAGTPRAAIYASAILLPLITVASPRLAGVNGVVLAFAQAATVVLLAGASARATASAARSFVAGTVALFVLIFAFYNWYELPVLWLVAAAGLVLCALPARSAPVLRREHAFAAAAGIVLTLAGTLGKRPANETQRAGERIRVLTYNIHQGFDAFGVPSMQSIADEIAAQNADIIALQEVGRGWTFVGGADLVAYLKYRFPGYEINFVPVNGQLWGVALVSRVPLMAISGHPFESAPHTFRYGFAAGTVRVGAADVRVISVHLTAGLEGNGGDGRVDQVDQLLREAASFENVIIAGDLNAHPHEPPLQKIAAAGYTDAGVSVGLGNMNTWPANAANERIDYVLLRGDVNEVSGSIKRTNASDHLPVLMTIRADNRDGTSPR